MTGNNGKNFGFGAGFLRDVLKDLKDEYTNVKPVEEKNCSAGTGFHPGDMILDTYRVDSEAIQGGMGAVWRVHHTGWNMSLAMKRPKPESFQTDNQKKNFTEECRHWINLGLHPNIVSCYYVREVEEVPTIFSEWMENGSLENHIKDGTLYEGTDQEVQERILDIAIQFARGLHYAHENNLIHQDVKPDNLLLSNSWDARVSDFGLAKARMMLTFLEGNATEPDFDSDATMVSPGGGRTPAYCSPEQAAAQLLTKRTDIYSWAVSVLEMYLGFKPWAHGRELTGPLVGSVCRDYFEMCTDRKIPEELKYILAECLEHDPDRRPKDFSSIEARLLRIYKETAGHPYLRSAAYAASDTADSLNNRALSFLDLGDYDMAMETWNRALQLERGHTACVFNRALARFRQEHPMPWEVLNDLDVISDKDEREKLTENLRREISETITVPSSTRNIRLKRLNITDYSGDGALLACHEGFWQHSTIGKYDVSVIAVYSIPKQQYILAVKAYEDVATESGRIQKITRSDFRLSRNGQYAAFDIEYKNPDPDGIHTVLVRHTAVVDLNRNSPSEKWYLELGDTELSDIPAGSVLHEFDYEGGVLNPDGSVIAFSVKGETAADCSVLFYAVKTGKRICQIKNAILLGFTMSGRVIILKDGNRVIFGGIPDHPIPKDAPFFICHDIDWQKDPERFLHQVSSQIAVFEKNSEESKKSGFLLDLAEGKIIAELQWEAGKEDDQAIGQFLLTKDQKYLIWLSGYIFNVSTKDKDIWWKWNTQYGHCVYGQVWDAATGKKVGYYIPMAGLYDYGYTQREKWHDYDLRGRMLAISIGNGSLLYNPEYRADYHLSVIANTTQRLEAEYLFESLLNRAETELSQGNRIAALRLADEAGKCQGFESDARPLKLRAKAGEGLAKKRLRRIVPSSEAAPLDSESEKHGAETVSENVSEKYRAETFSESVSEKYGAEKSSDKQTFLKTARMDLLKELENSESDDSYYEYKFYMGDGKYSEDGLYCLIPTLIVENYDSPAQYDIEITHYHGLAIAEASTGRILYRYRIIYSHDAEGSIRFSTANYDTILRSDPGSLWLLSRENNLVLRLAGSHTVIKISNGWYQYASFLSDERYILAQRMNGTVEVFDLTGGQSLREVFPGKIDDPPGLNIWNEASDSGKMPGIKNVTFNFPEKEYGPARLIDDNCFAIEHNGTYEICRFDWEYEEETNGKSY